MPQDMVLPNTPARYSKDLEKVEVELLLEGIFRHYGFDFRSYAYSSLKRRLWKRIHAEGLQSVSALQERVLHDGRGSVLHGDPAAGGGAVRPRPHLRHRHQRGGAPARPRRDLPAGED